MTKEDEIQISRGDNDGMGQERKRDLGHQIIDKEEVQIRVKDSKGRRIVKDENRTI